mgnify:CR=1 FL=1
MNNETMHQVLTRRRLTDPRGWFLKVVDGREPGNPFTCEVYFTAAPPGESRGGHYHLLASEWFTLVRGKAVLRLTSLASGTTETLELNASDPLTVHVPPGIVHTFTNSGEEEFLLVAYTDRLYDPADTLVPGDPGL